MTLYRVIDRATGEVLSDLPSPRLIVEGGGLAWSPAGHFWRVREAENDPPGTTYTRVRIAHLTEWTVDVRITVIETTGAEPVEYDDFFWPKAETRDEATAIAVKEAEYDIEQRFGEVAGSGIYVTRVREGQHFK